MSTDQHTRTDLLDVHEVARRLGISAYQVRAHRKQGNLPAVNVSLGARPTWRWSPSAIDTFKRNRRTP